MRGRFIPSSHQVDPRGGAEGGCYRRQDGDGEVDDFLPKFFFHGVVWFGGCLFLGTDYTDFTEFCGCILSLRLVWMTRVIRV